MLADIGHEFIEFRALNEWENVGQRMKMERSHHGTSAVELATVIQLLLDLVVRRCARSGMSCSNR